MTEDLEDLIDAALAAGGMTQAQLAERLGVHGSTIWRWLNGRAEPQRAIRARLAHALGVSVDRLRAAIARTGSNVAEAS